jgi:hypothetical protein
VRGLFGQKPKVDFKKPGSKNVKEARSKNTLCSCIYGATYIHSNQKIEALIHEIGSIKEGLWFMGIHLHEREQL